YNAWGLYGVDSWKLKPYLTAELGLRWEWVMTPTEAADRSSLFDPTTDTLRLTPRPYSQNNKEFQPRVGLSWDVFHDGKTVLRTAYGILYDQLLPGPFLGSGNFPFGLPLSFTSSTAAGAKQFTSFATLLPDSSGALTATSVRP